MQKDDIKATEVDCCGNCKFWKIDAKNLDRGNCRKHPPKIAPLNGPQGIGWITGWPSTQTQEWCGEYESRYQITN